MATKNIEICINTGSGYDTLYPKTLGSLVNGTVSSATTASSCSGNSATATTLATARTIRTNLASTSTASFNGGSNITPGVTGTLSVSNGGTGVTSLATLSTNLIQQSNLGCCRGSYVGTLDLNDVLAGRVQVITLPVKAWQIRGITLKKNGDYNFGISMVGSELKTSSYTSIKMACFRAYTKGSSNYNLNPTDPGTYNNLACWDIYVFIGKYYDEENYKQVSISENQIAIGTGKRITAGSSDMTFAQSNDTYYYNIYYVSQIV